MPAGRLLKQEGMKMSSKKKWFIEVKDLLPGSRWVVSLDSKNHPYRSRRRAEADAYTFCTFPGSNLMYRIQELDERSNDEE